MTLKLVNDNFVPTKKIEIGKPISEELKETLTDEIETDMNYGYEYLESTDAIENAIECITCDGLDNISLSEIECYDDRVLVQYLLDNNQDALFDMCISVYTEGYHREENELCSLNVGETEHQLDETLTEKILKLTNDDIEDIFNSTDFYFNSDDIIKQKTAKYPCIMGYINRDYDRYSMILGLDLLHEYFSNNLEVA